MKTLSSLLLLIMSVTSCSLDSRNLEYEEFEEEEDYEDYQDEDFYYFDSESSEDRLNCPSFYQKFELKNIKYLIKIPSECHLNYIETGRPNPDQEHEYQNNVILEQPYSSQGY